MVGAAGRGERRPPGIRLPSPAFLDPLRDQRRVGPGIQAWLRQLKVPGLVWAPFAEALADPGHVGQQVRPASRASLRSAATAAACSSSVSGWPPPL